MSSHTPQHSSVAEQLLDAQVRYHLDRLSGDALAATVSEFAEQILTATDQHPIETLVDRDALTSTVVRALATVPASGVVGRIVELATTTAFEGPTESFPLGDLVERAQVEALVDALLAVTPASEEALARLTDIPSVGTVASRFIGRIINDVMATNQAIANKVPGLGSLMSLGTGAATKFMGAADKQFESMVGRGLDQGGAYAVSHLNRILIETLRDPVTREAILQVWDLIEADTVAGLSAYATREEVDGVADAVHDLVITALASEHTADLVRVIVDGFFDRFGGYTPAELLDALEIDRDLLVADVGRLAPKALTALRESGGLEHIVRAQLEPFYASPEVGALLG